MPGINTHSHQKATYPTATFVEGATTHRSGEEESDTHESEQVPDPAQLDMPDRVQVPRINFVPCSVFTSSLLASVDPMTPSTDCGRSLYRTAVHTVGQHLQVGCVQCKLDD